jgi:integrase
MAAVAGKPDDLWARLPDYEARAGAQAAARVRPWLESCGDTGAAAITAYLRSLQRDGLSDGTVDLRYRSIRAFCRFCGVEPPRAPSWHYDGSDAHRPALAPGNIALLVEAARRSPSVVEAARLCLSTLYGMRVGEIAEVQGRDVDLASGRLYIRTLKGGEPRWCWIPPEARPWLDITWVPTATRRVSATFHALWDASLAAERPPRVAWHAVRRALVRDLGASGVGKDERIRFLRWAGDDSMDDLYVHPNEVVTEAGVVERVAETDQGRQEADAQVWRLHPYRALWR